MFREGLLPAALLLLAGCASPGSPRLVGEALDTEVAWGEAIVIGLRNEGDAAAEDIRLEVWDAERAVFTFAWPHPVPPRGALVLSWNGTTDAGGMALWGAYEGRVHWDPGDGSLRVPLTLLEPPRLHLRVTVEPQIASSTTARHIFVENAGTARLEGNLTALVGNASRALYVHEEELRLDPGQQIELVWNGRAPDGTPAPRGVYQVGALLDRNGHRMPATTWLRVT